MNKIINILLLILLVVTISGCSQHKQVASVDGSVKITDANKRQVTIVGVPKRIVVLSPSFLDMVQALDGNVVGRAESAIVATPDFARDAAEVGYVFNINIEKVVSLKPDLVIAYKGMHERFLPLLESNNISAIVCNLKTYDDVKASMRLLGAALGKREKAEAVNKRLDADIAAIVDKLPRSSQSVAILHSTPNGLTLERETSIAGCCAKLLGLQNIISGNTTRVAGSMGNMPDQAPYSLEALVEANPQVVLITSMGNRSEIEGRLESDAFSNPAWQTVDAVKNKRVYYLPDELFLLNPCLRYPLAVELLASKIYPESVKEQKYD